MKKLLQFILFCTLTSALFAQNNDCSATISSKKVETYYQLEIVPKPADIFKSVVWSTTQKDRAIKVYANGEYCAEVTFNNGCITKVCTKITDLATPKGCELKLTSRAVEGGFILTASLSPSTLPFEISWGTGESSKEIKVTKSGTYCTKVQGRDGCVASKCIDVIIPNPPPCRIAIAKRLDGGKDILCLDAASTLGTITTIAWSTGDSTKCIIPTKSGEYCVKILTKEGCETKACIIYTAPPTPSDCKVEIVRKQDGDKVVLCASTKPGEGDILKYSWSNGETTQCISPQKTGQYCVTIVTKGKCETKACIDFVAPNPPPCRIAIAKRVDGGKDILCLDAPATIGTITKILWSTGDSTRCITPTKSGEYCVKILTKEGCETKACINYTVPVPPTECKVEIVRKQDGDKIVLCAVTRPGESDILRYAWVSGESTSCITPQKTGQYCVYIVTKDKCETKACIDIVIPTVPVCKVNVVKRVDGGKDILCLDAPPTIGTITKILWSTGDSTRCITPTKSGEYCVKILTKEGCETKACINYTVPVPPTECKVEIVRKQDGNKIVLCASTRPGEGDILKYSWSNGETTPCISPQKTGQYCVTIVTKGKCETKACIDFVAPNPPSCRIAIVKKIDGGKDILCLDSLASLGSITTIAWSSGDSTKCITPTKSGEYCVKIITKEGCETKACFNYTAPTSSNDCKVEIVRKQDGNKIVLCASTRPGEGDILKYSWSNGETTPCISPQKTGQYCVTIVTKGKCETKACIDFVAHNPPTECKVLVAVDISGHQVKLCADTRNIKSDVVKYSWSSGETTSCIIPQKSGSYCVTIFTKDGCESKDCVNYVKNIKEDSCKVTIVRKIVNGRINLCLETTSTSEISEIAWNGVVVKDRCIVTTQPGDYCVKIKTKSGCEAKACVTVGSTFVQDNDGQINSLVSESRLDERGNPLIIQSLEVYPNPVTDFVNIAIEARSDLKVKTSFFNLQGRKVQNQSFDLQKGMNHVSLMMSDLPTGLYVLNITVDDYTEQIRLMKF